MIRSQAFAPITQPLIEHSTTLTTDAGQQVEHAGWMIKARDFTEAEYVDPAGVTHSGLTASISLTRADHASGGALLAIFPGRIAIVGTSSIAALEIAKDGQERNYAKINIEP